eukprot:CAMPEP_0196571492 /NCGR_PEP_ID=MMETSP1081-20130531/1659_1 /TAXON_ID=36882 /ORGANISM="Pyramimonas amylifera, Strain CCMP720" /LENGTH=253 /DNA_ID=CAMNT_0041888461 /DNA_START=64 /DNA_END=825 /DNA_ORIENTATION=+
MGHGINLGELVPDFDAQTSTGPISWHKWIAGSWAILCSHPADFTPVCTTELGALAKLMPEFETRGVKVAALSCNDEQMHKDWIKDIEATDFSKGCKVDYPIIADPKREIATKYGMLDPEEKNAAGLPMTCRAVFVIGPDKTLKLSILYPATTGRQFEEILRVIDSLQLTAKHSVATPCNWTSGQKCMVVPSLTDEQANAKFACGFKKIDVPSGKGYIRLTDDPSGSKPKLPLGNVIWALGGAVVAGVATCLAK